MVSGRAGSGGIGRRVAAALVAAAAALVAVAALSGPDPAGAATEIRGVYGGDPSADGAAEIAALGFNAVNVTMFEEDRLDRLHRRGMKAVVWTGDADRRTCVWEFSDAEVREAIEEIAGHPAIAAYQIGDEPGYARVGNCPDIVDLYRDRHELIESVDPDNPTYTVLASFDGEEEFPYQYWSGVLDLYGINVYPCAYEWSSCRFGLIDEAARELERDGIDRYWAVIQDFDDGWYRRPTPAEVAEQLDRWRSTAMSGYFVYDWDLTDIADNPRKQSVYRDFNSQFEEDDPAPVAFTDVEGSVHAPDIFAIARQGITRGCNPPANTRFCPASHVSRGQMAAFLVRALELATRPDDRFTDDDSSVFELDIDAAAVAGIARGCNPPANTRFCPYDPVSRGEMAAFLGRALSLSEGSDADAFGDDDGSVFEADIDRLAAARITFGCGPGRFCPRSPVTREQMASFLRRALDVREE